MPAPRRVSARQMELLVEFAEANPNIALGRFPGGPQGAQTTRQIWHSTASKLNSIAEGSTKTVDQWRRYWIDFKAKSKAKAADARRRATGTGGGPNNLLPLTELEKRVLALMGAVAVQGLPEVRLPIDSSVPTPNPDPLMVEEWLEDLSSTPGSQIMTTLPASTFLDQPSTSATSEQPQDESYIVPELDPVPVPSNNAPPLVEQPQEIHAQRSDRSRRVSIRRQRPRREVRADARVPSWALEIETRRVAAEERNAAAMERNAAAMERNAAAIERNAAAMERNAAAMEALVQSVREIRNYVHM